MSSIPASKKHLFMTEAAVLKLTTVKLLPLSLPFSVLSASLMQLMPLMPLMSKKWWMT